MVRVLHTADVHLEPGADERRAALAAVLDRAVAADADVVTVGGDLFESELAAEQCRDSLRAAFADRPFPVVTIPGNHDADAFRGDLFFGEAFLPATERPFEHVVVEAGNAGESEDDADEPGDDADVAPAADAARVTCLPYTPEATDDLLVSLRDREPFDGPEFLLLHCSLEAPVRGGVGDEGDHRYFPVGKAALAELGFDYYLAGHYHSRHRTELDDGATFVYPGTPSSVTRSETGQRTCVLIDTEAPRDVTLETLDTFHYDAIEARVTPGEEDEVLSAVASQVATWDDRNVEARVAVDGFLARDEAAFAEALADASGDVPVENRTRSVEHVLSHPLFEDFEARLAEREFATGGPDAADDPTDSKDRASAATSTDGAPSTDAADAENGTVDDPERFREDVRAAVVEAFAELSAEGRLS